MDIEIPAQFEIVRCPRTPSDVEPEGYLAANPDVAQHGLDPVDHFTRYGQKEGRIQFINSQLVKSAREIKLNRVRFKSEPCSVRTIGEPYNFLSDDVIRKFEIPESPPVSAHAYGEGLGNLIASDTQKLYLDIGAGLRNIYFGNVVNSEIFCTHSTDVLCVGEDLPFDDDQFDGVFCLAVLEHTQKPWKVAQELVRVLKPGGQAIIDYPFLQPLHGYPHHYFNATPVGHRLLFKDLLEITSLKIGDNQKPIYALYWIMKVWRDALVDRI